MTFSYDDKIRVLEAWKSVNPDFMSGAGAAYYSRLLSILNEDDDFNCNIPLYSDEFIHDDFLSIVVEELDVFFGNSGTGQINIVGCDKGVGSFSVEGFYPELPPGIDYAGTELINALPDADFTVEEFVQAFSGNSPATQTEQDYLVTMPKGVFDAFLAYSNGEYEFENEIFDEQDKKALVGFWLDGVYAAGDVDGEYSETGLGYQYGVTVRNRDIDKWLKFIPRNFASKEDVKEGERLLSRLISAYEDHYTYWCSNLCVSSFDASDIALGKGDALGRTFEIHCILCRDAIENGYTAAEFSACALLTPEILVEMLRVKSFLERMENKYHYSKGEKKKNGK